MAISGFSGVYSLECDVCGADSGESILSIPKKTLQG